VRSSSLDHLAPKDYDAHRGLFR